MTRIISDFNAGSQRIAQSTQMFAVSFKIQLLTTLALNFWLTWYQIQRALGGDQLTLIAMKGYAAARRFMEFDPH